MNVEVFWFCFVLIRRGISVPNFCSFIRNLLIISTVLGFGGTKMDVHKVIRVVTSIIFEFFQP